MKKFEEGKSYYVAVDTFVTVVVKVTKRTAKMIYVEAPEENAFVRNSRYVVFTNGNVEYIKLGSYADSPRINAFHEYGEAEKVIDENNLQVLRSWAAESCGMAREEVDASEYVVSAEAQDAAIEGEIENAASMKEESTNTPIETVDTVSAETLVKLNKLEMKAAMAFFKKFSEDNKPYCWFDSKFGVEAELVKEMQKRMEEYGETSDGHYQMNTSNFHEELRCLCNGLTTIWTHEEGIEFYYSNTHGLNNLSFNANAVQKLTIRILKEAFEYLGVSGSVLDSCNEMFKSCRPLAGSCYRPTHRRLAMKVIAELKREESTNTAIEEEVDVSEYAVNVEAQEVAIEAEIENAASEKVKVNSDITDAAIAQVEKVQEISTADLEYLLKGYQAEMRTCQNSIKKSREIIQDNQEYIIKALAQIAGFENMIMRYGLYIEEDAKKLEELKETAAKINAKLLSRQFKASALIESVKAAEKVQEVAGVNFDLQQFNDAEINIAGSAATIDTAVSKTEVPYIEDDSDEEALIEEYYALDAEVDGLHKKFTEKRKELNETRRKLEDVLKKKFKATQDKFYKTVEKAGEDDATIDLYPEYVIAYDSVSLAEYRTLDAVKAAVDKLAAAIERGDKEFTFPMEEVQVENKSAEVEIKSAVSEIETYDSKIDALQAQIAELNEAKEKAKRKLDMQSEELKKFVMETVKFKPIEGANVFAGRLINIGRRTLTELEKEWLEVEIDGGKVRLIEVASRKVVLAEYSSVKEFKAAIRELGAAIERGDKEFTFPADK